MDSIKIKVLGSGGYYPSEERHTSCYAVPEINTVLDAGTGFFRIAKHLDMTKELHLLFSHYHDDHTAGLFWLMGLYKGPKVNIYGPDGIESLKHVFEGVHSPFDLADHPFEINFTQLEKSFSIGSHQIDFHSVPHAHPTLAYMISAHGKSLAYVTDTSASLENEDFLSDIDLLIHECYLKDEAIQTAINHQHTCPKMLTPLLEKISCPQVFLSHMNPSYSEEDILELERAVGFNAKAAFDLQEISI